MARDDTNVNGLLFQDAATLWTSDYTPNVAGGPTLIRYARDAVTGLWAITATVAASNFTFNGVAYSVTGARGLVGYTSPSTGNFNLVYSTSVASGSTSNFLVRYGEGPAAACMHLFVVRAEQEGAMNTRSHLL